MRLSRKLIFFVLSLFILYSSFVLIRAIDKGEQDKSLAILANQFLHGHISIPFTKDMPLGDISKFGGRFYLYFGPFASIILMPFVAIFGKNFPQLTIGLLSLALSFFAIYSISRSFKFTKIDALWLALFFCFSTVLFAASIINISAYQVEVLGVPLVLLALREYFSKKNFLLIGLFLGLAIMTRELLLLSLVFFVIEFFKKRITPKQLIIIFIPVVVAGLLLATYNYLRFKSPTETGYIYSINLDSYPLSVNLHEGYMSIKHIPASLYSFLIMSPQPLLEKKDGFILKFPYLKASPWGMAIWFTSPLFLALLYKFKKNKYTFPALITFLCLALPLFTYFSIGFAQFGYRYALDFLPFLFLLLIPSLQPRLSKKDIALICVGVIFNCIYIGSLWEIYPVFGIHP
ncbi:MAG TPA: hypothetical protein VKC89_01880 [Patescibacteria group bacterium]|nr:hypothetical protein [Patescibacteria group bacterium]